MNGITVYFFFWLMYLGSFRFTARLRFSICPLPCPHAPTLPSYPTSPTRVVCSLRLNLHWRIMITQSPWFTLGFTLGVVHPIGLDKCIMTFTHHHSIKQNIFTELKILCVYLSIISPDPPAPGNRRSFHSIVCLCKYHEVGIIQYIASAVWLLSLTNMHLRSLHIFSWLGSPFIFIAK